MQEGLWLSGFDKAVQEAPQPVFPQDLFKPPHVFSACQLRGVSRDDPQDFRGQPDHEAGERRDLHLQPAHRRDFDQIRAAARATIGSQALASVESNLQHFVEKAGPPKSA